MFGQKGNHHVHDLPSQDSHISCTGLPICHFPDFSCKLSIQSYLQSIHEGSHPEAWSAKRGDFGGQTNRKMPSLGRTWTRSSALVDFRTSFFKGSDDEEYTQCDQWNTQKLSHIQLHGLFKIHLNFFQEFPSKARSEHQNEK